MLRLSEHYTSVQGEGPLTGVPTQFVRFAGCNYRCPGWPCDTEHAIDPAIWRYESEKLEWYVLRERIVKEATATGARNICFTGGEPMMQPENDLVDLMSSLCSQGYSTELFTNGSYNLVDVHAALSHVMLDWKLQGSGEGQKDLDARRTNMGELGPNDGVKFVVKDLGDLEEARALSVGWGYPPFTIWVGRVWHSSLTDAMIVKWMLERKLPWRLNVQMHKYVWDENARRT